MVTVAKLALIQTAFEFKFKFQVKILFLQTVKKNVRGVAFIQY